MIDYWLNTTYACGMISTLNGTIYRTCPIYKWMIGKTPNYILRYLKRTKRLIAIEELPND